MWLIYITSLWVTSNCRQDISIRWHDCLFSIFSGFPCRFKVFGFFPAFRCWAVLYKCHRYMVYAVSCYAEPCSNRTHLCCHQYSKVHHYIQINSFITCGVMICLWPLHHCLTHLDLSKVVTSLQRTYLNEFSWPTMPAFRFNSRCIMFRRAQLTIKRHWFRQWLDAEQVILAIIWTNDTLVRMRETQMSTLIELS